MNIVLSKEKATINFLPMVGSLGANMVDRVISIIEIMPVIWFYSFVSWVQELFRLKKGQLS